MVPPPPRIVIIGPGRLSIPPDGWGAVESGIWDQKHALERLGWAVRIVNTRNARQIILEANEFQPDVVHLHWDGYLETLASIRARVKISTTHHSFQDQEDWRALESIPSTIASGAYIFCLSDRIRDVFLRHGAPPDRLVLHPNGADPERFRFAPICRYPDRTLYLGRVSPRKQQLRYQDIDGLYFAGPGRCPQFTDRTRYLGAWSRSYVGEHLTDYASLCLLSAAEAAPLVCPEALLAGLGLVLSERATANLDAKPWITIVPTGRLGDLDHVRTVLRENREISVRAREEIRAYGLARFSWSEIYRRYADVVRGLLAQAPPIDR